MDGGDPINNIDPNGTKFFTSSHADAVAADAGANVAGEVSKDEVWSEAQAAARQEFGLKANPSPGTVLAPGKTFQGVTQWYYDQKEQWYLDAGFYVVPQAEYDRDAAPVERNISAYNPTPQQQAMSDAVMERQQAIDNGTAPPNTDFVVNFYHNNPNPTAWQVFGTTVQITAPDLAMAIGGMPKGGGPSQSMGNIAEGGVPQAEGSLYDVGYAKDLRNTSVPFTQVHHVGQSAQADALLGDFNAVNRVGNEPAIRITESEHTAVNAAQPNYPTPASARDLLARDITILRNETNAPNAALKELIELNKTASALRPWDYNVKGK